MGRRGEAEASLSTAARCECLFVIGSADVGLARVEATVALRAGKVQQTYFFAELRMK